MKYRGSCHCGDNRFEVEGKLEQVIECNCSHCSRKGFLLWFVPRAALALTTPKVNLSTYMFNKHVIQHMFCKRCGTQPFGYGVGPDGVETAAINIRCLADVVLDEIPRQPFDGRSL
jgi:hypothetical protein